MKDLDKMIQSNKLAPKFGKNIKIKQIKNSIKNLVTFNSLK